MIPSEVGIYLCTTPVDMRYGFDRLCRIVREQVEREPQEGGLFVFSNRAATRLKVLWFEKNGCCFLYKRLHRARFQIPSPDGVLSITIDRDELARVLEGKARSAGRSSGLGLTTNPSLSTTTAREQLRQQRATRQSA